MKEVSHEVTDSTRVYVATHYHVTRRVLIVIVNSAKIPVIKKNVKRAENFVWVVEKGKNGSVEIVLTLP